MFVCYTLQEVDMNYKLRSCCLEDLEFILELKTLGMKWYIEKLYGWDLGLQREITKQEMNSKLEDIKIVTLGSKDIGVTTFSEYKDFYEVGLIVIHPDYQNKGIATSIIKKYINTAKMNKKRIVIKTYKENPAKNLYLKLGFTIFKTDKTHLYLEK